MALIHCPECNKQVSDRAAECPSCGCPLHDRPNESTSVEPPPLPTSPVAFSTSKPEPRPVIVVLLLSVVTLGIYFIVYLFRTIRQIDSHVSFRDTGITPSQAREKLVWSIVASVAGALICVFCIFSFSASREGEQAALMMSLGMTIRYPTWFTFWVVVARCLFAWSFVLQWKPFFELLKRAYSAIGHGLRDVVAVYGAGDVRVHRPGYGGYGSLNSTSWLIPLGAVAYIIDLPVEFLTFKIRILPSGLATFLTPASVWVTWGVKISLFFIAVLSVNRLWTTVPSRKET